MNSLIEGKLLDLEQLSDPVQFLPRTTKGFAFKKININQVLKKAKNLDSGPPAYCKFPTKLVMTYFITNELLYKQIIRFINSLESFRALIIESTN